MLEVVASVCTQPQVSIKRCRQKQPDKLPYFHLISRVLNFEKSRTSEQTNSNNRKNNFIVNNSYPRRPRSSQSGREKRRDERFQLRAKESLGTDSHRTISKNSSGCRLLIGHKKCFVLLCPIGEQFLLSSFREFVHDGYCFNHGLCGSCTKEIHAVRKLSF